MLPGVVTGQYSIGRSEIDVGMLAQRADARFRRAAISALDLDARVATLDNGSEEFDILSLDIGAVADPSFAGLREHAITVKPARAFLNRWRELQADAERGNVRTIAMVGGGAAGVEMVLAMHWKLSAALGERTPRFVLISDQSQLLPTHAPKARLLLGRTLVSRGIVVRLGTPAIAVEHNAVVLADQSRVAAERVIVATTPAAAPWLRETGLACDEKGFVRVNAQLQSTSHPFVFAAGDCATNDGTQSRKGGVHAVREGRPLGTNLARYAAGRDLVAHQPSGLALAIIGTGNRNAVVAWGRFAAQGEWAWRWKDRLDRGFVERFRALPRVG
jgi:selenide, water dikinase